MCLCDRLAFASYYGALSDTDKVIWHCAFSLLGPVRKLPYCGVSYGGCLPWRTDAGEVKYLERNTAGSRFRLAEGHGIEIGLLR
jgi:hypothetical protein